MREAAGWTVVWCLLALAFNVLIWTWQGGNVAQQFLTGYLIEWSLSMDNVFVFAVIFNFFKVPRKYQHRVLFWGILGAVVLRLTFILVGSEFVSRFNVVLPVLGAFLVFTGIKLAIKGDTEAQPDKNVILRTARKVMRVAHGDHGNRFFVREAGRLAVTPLFLVLLVVESTDVVFAVDSVPAIFGVVTQGSDYFTFIVFTSNVFAILGLRALYFLLAGMMDLFRYLAYGLSAILVFVGVKMVVEYLAHQFWGLKEGHHLVPPWASLMVVIGLLATSMVASVISRNRDLARDEIARAAKSEPTTDDDLDQEGAQATDELPAGPRTQ